MRVVGVIRGQETLTTELFAQPMIAKKTVTTKATKSAKQEEEEKIEGEVERA